MNPLEFGRIGALNLIVDDSLLTLSGTIRVKKTFKEHFTWKFWEMYKEVPNWVPSTQVYFYEKNIICHSVVAKEIRKTLPDYKGGYYEH